MHASKLEACMSCGLLPLMTAHRLAGPLFHDVNNYVNGHCGPFALCMHAQHGGVLRDNMNAINYSARSTAWSDTLPTRGQRSLRNLALPFRLTLLSETLCIPLPPQNLFLLSGLSHWGRY